jgi:hypothetical protein
MEQSVLANEEPLALEGLCHADKVKSDAPGAQPKSRVDTVESACGASRTLGDAPAMSAIHPRADVEPI